MDGLAIGVRVYGKEERILSLVRARDWVCHLNRPCDAADLITSKAGQSASALDNVIDDYKRNRGHAEAIVGSVHLKGSSRWWRR